MPDTYVAQARPALGKAATKLRREGTLPGNIYGRALQSQAVQMSSRDVIALLKAHGPNTLIQLQVEGEPQARSVVVRGVQRHPRGLLPGGHLPPHPGAPAGDGHR